MSRKDILSITEDVLDIVSNRKEYSINSISNKAKIQWKTALKILEFLERIKLIKERKGKITHRAERLFQLVK